MEAKISNEEIISEFKKKRIRQTIAVFPIIIAIICIVSVEDNPTGLFGIPPNAIMDISIALIFSILIFSLFN